MRRWAPVERADMGNKIDEWKRAAGFAASLRNLETKASRADTDKFGATVKLTDTYIGYYGCSSCGSWGGDAIVKAVEREISDRWKWLIRCAAERAECEAEKLRKDAQEEARAVLEETRSVAVAQSVSS